MSMTSSLVTSPRLRLSRSLLGVISLEQKDSPITQKIPKDVGALCEKLGLKTKY